MKWKFFTQMGPTVEEKMSVFPRGDIYSTSNDPISRWFNAIYKRSLTADKDCKILPSCKGERVGQNEFSEEAFYNLDPVQDIFM